MQSQYHQYQTNCPIPLFDSQSHPHHDGRWPQIPHSPYRHTRYVKIYEKDIRNTAMIIMCSYCDLSPFVWTSKSHVFCHVPYRIGTCKGEKMVIALKNSIFHYTQQIPSVWREGRSARQNGHKKTDLHLKGYLPNYLLFWYHNYSPTDFPTINTWAYQVLDIKKKRNIRNLKRWKKQTSSI